MMERAHYHKVNIESRCKVVKTKEKFYKACDLGYGINFYGCSEKEMWLILSVDEETLMGHVKEDGFEILGVNSEACFQVRNK